MHLGLLFYGNLINRAVSSMTNQNKARDFLHDWLYVGRREKIFIAANIVRNSSGRVMSATPTKVCKRGRKPKIDIQKKQQLQILWSNLYSGGGRASFENLVSPSGREESVGPILAEYCGLIGFPLTRDGNFSERVCRSWSRKIRNAAEL